ncbi:MAG TPA: phospholipase D-like domain-containing protein [Candidatus Brocadiales bacterium]|nr:phospholipase D-like domain-containing protein [Candidatus Brocadiales bacterium]
MAIGYWLFLFSPLAALAGIEVLFSPRDNINYRIIEAVNLSEERIDVATFDFTSSEIADALLNAKSKGLRVRLLVDKDLLEDKDSKAKYLEEKGIDIKALKGKGKGVMKNSFVIFDGRLVIVGPYHLAEDKESYDYENAIFFDDSGIVETYQNEFDRLFGSRSLTTATKTLKDSLLSTVIQPSSQELSVQSSELGVRTEGQDVTSNEIKPVVRTKETGVSDKPPATLTTNTSYSEALAKDTSPPTTVRDITQTTLPAPVEPTTAPATLINISFEELDKIFGKEGTLPDTEKNDLWVAQYYGRYVKWTGEVSYTYLGLVKGIRIGFKHKAAQPKEYESNTDVEVVGFSLKKAPKVMKIAEGDTVTYTAKLYSYPTKDTPYYVLNEGSLE